VTIAVHLPGTAGIAAVHWRVFSLLCARNDPHRGEIFAYWDGECREVAGLAPTAGQCRDRLRVTLSRGWSRRLAGSERTLRANALVHLAEPCQAEPGCPDRECRHHTPRFLARVVAQRAIFDCV
jgi:hypothetical protein